MLESHPQAVLQGRTAFMLAGEQGQLAAMRMLLAYGAYYDVYDKQGRSHECPHYPT